MNACRRAAPLVETFVDGELPADKVIEFEQHLAECGSCTERVRFDNALRTSMRSAVRTDVDASPEFQARLLAALSAEQEREQTHQLDRPRALPWRAIVPMAAAAAFTLMWAASTNEHKQHRTTGRDLAAMNSAGGLTQNVDQMVDELVSYHANQNGLPQVTEPQLAEKFEPEVGVPVRVPSLSQYGAHWEGGSTVPVRNRRAASLRFRIDNHRVTLYVYDSSRFPLRAALEPRVVRNMPVYVGNRRGYSIAAAERRGVGYAVASDLNDSESAELVAASLVH